MDARRPPSALARPLLFTAVALIGVAVLSQVALVSVRDGASISAKRRIDRFLLSWLRPVCEGGNEVSAISTLRGISSGQSQLVAAGVVDQDGDGVGEFGTLAEMSGAVALRGTDRILSPSVLSGVFRTAQPDGSVVRSGYRFRLYLVGRDGKAFGERAGGGRVPPGAEQPGAG